MDEQNVIEVSKKDSRHSKYLLVQCQQIFTCSMSAIETLEKSMKYLQS